MERNEVECNLSEPQADFDRVVRVPWPEEKLPFKLKEPKCPICGGKLFIDSVDACELDDNDEWIATEVQLRCETEPSADSPDWEQWMDNHYSTPYIDWLPLETKILKAVRARYYFAP